MARARCVQDARGPDLPQPNDGAEPNQMVAWIGVVRDIEKRALAERRNSMESSFECAPDASQVRRRRFHSGKAAKNPGSPPCR